MISPQNERKLPSLKIISSFTIWITLLFFMSAIVFVFVWNMLHMLERHERENIRQNGDIISSIIRVANADFQSITRDWSSWDETYAYVLGENDGYIEDTLTDYPFLLHNLHIAVLKDIEGTDLYARFYNFTAEEVLPVPDGFTDRLSEIGGDMLKNFDPDHADDFKAQLGRDGFLFYDGVCYYICAMPILTSDENAEPIGCFFFGRIYNAEEISRITDHTYKNYSILDRSSPEMQNLNISFSEGEAFSFDKNNVVYYKTLTDYFGDDSIVIRIEESRSLYQDGLSVIAITCVVAAVAALLLIMLIMFWINRYLLYPLARLSADMGSITTAASPVDIDSYGRNREFYVLGSAINKMFDRLKQGRINLEKSTVSLNVLKAILNGMDAYLYVSDMETDEILFINDKMKENFHLTGDMVGCVCWRVLQSGFEERCEFCPNRQLSQNPDTPVIWEEHNTVTHRYYRNVDCVIDWTDGKKVHLQHSTDITDITLAQVSLQKRLKQQELMSAISQSFTTTQDTRPLIYKALKMAGEFMNVNQAFLSIYKRDESVLDCLYEWYDEKGQPFIGAESKWPISPEMEIYKNLTIDGYAAINDFPAQTHPNFQIVSEYEIWAFLNIPVEISGQFWGILGFIIYNHSYEWNESDIYLGKLIAGVFSGVVSRNIAEENLLQAKEAAEQASKAKGEFLSRMSHEMRTPMNAIIGMTNIAMGTQDSQKKEYCLAQIDNASRHLLGVINDILDMSKIEANKFELSPSEFDLEKMLMHITRVVMFRVEEKKQNLIVNVGKDVPLILSGDEMRLSQVITNLLTNAVKFTPDGGTITLNIYNEHISNGVLKLRIEVIDTGIGISPEQQARLFTSFEQADGGIARKYGGTGLGLAICKKIVELMDGRIWIESELGQGSKFAFTVILKLGQQTPGWTPTALAIGDNIRILALDSASETRDYFAKVLSTMKLSYDTADSGEAALKLIEEYGENQYCILFADWRVHDFNVVELIKRVKYINPKSVVIVMIPAAEWDKIKKDAIVAGASGFISKPLFQSMIMDAINETIGKYPVHDDPDTYDFEGNTLLLAEDIDINREIILTLLEDTQLCIDCAQNGIEAFSMFEKNPGKYDLILMDIHMPEMDGYEATRRIRSLDREEAKNIPVIAMTANVFREDIEKCLQAGMNGHLGKPVDIEKLISTLNQYLRSK